MQRRKEFTSSTKAELKEFEKELSTKRRNLRHVRRFSDIELHRVMKMKEIFLKEKDVRKKQLEEELHIQGKLADRKREQERRQLLQNSRWKDVADLPPPGPVRKARSHLSVNSMSDNGDGYSGRDGFGIPFHACRSDDQVMPQYPAYKSTRGTPGSSLMHQQLQSATDDHKRHSLHVGGGLSQDSGYSYGDHLASSSTYDSLAKVKESFAQADSSSNKKKSKRSTIGHGHQIKVYHSPVPQNSLAATSTTSTASGTSSTSSTGAKSKRISSGSGGQSVNLQALTMLPTGAGSAGGGGGGANYKFKQQSPLVTKRMDAQGGGGASSHGKALSDFMPPSKSHQSQSVTKGQHWRKSQHMNGLPSRYQMYDYNSQPDTFNFGYNDNIMEHSSLSQPVEADMPMSSGRRYPRRFSPDLVPLRTAEQSQANSKSFYRSASDESVYDTLRTSSRTSRASIRAKDFNVKESRSWAKTFAMSVFGSFTSDKDKNKDKSKSSKNKHRSHQKQQQQQHEEHGKGGQSSSKGATMSSTNQSRFHHTYSHHTPKSMKVKSSKKHGESSLLSPEEQPENKSLRFNSESNQHNLSLPSGAPPPLHMSSQGHVGHNYMANGGNMPHPNSAPSLQTMTTRPSGGGKGTGSLFSGEVPLTSYPRSHTQAMQHMRGTTTTTSSSGAGRQQSNYKVPMSRIHNGGGVGGRGYRDQQYSQNGQFKNSLSNNNLTDVAILGSLV